MDYKLDGRAVRAARLGRKMTQAGLAIRLRELQIGWGWSQGQISKLERSREPWGVTEWQAMCFGVALTARMSRLASAEQPRIPMEPRIELKRLMDVADV
jgi:hypothetical protein